MALEALSSGKVRPERLVSAEFPLTDARDALTLAAEKGVLKVLLNMEG